jgi:hypothetical protein
LQFPNEIIISVGCWWLTPAIPGTQEAEIGRIMVTTQPREIVSRSYLEKYPSQKGLAEWLKVKAEFKP